MDRQAMFRAGLVGLSLVLAACATPSARPSSPGATSQQPAAPASRAPKILSVVLVGEPRALTTWQESTTGGVVNIHELITTGLLTLNTNSEPIPRLAVEVPSVDKGTWKVSHDGTMETTYRLRPEALWHDGTPVTAKDVAFSARAHLDPKVDMNPVHRGLATGGLERVTTLDDSPTSTGF